MDNKKEENPFFTAFRTKQGKLLFIFATAMLIAVSLITKYAPADWPPKMMVTTFGCIFMMVSVSEFMRLVGVINEQNNQNNKKKK